MSVENEKTATDEILAEKTKAEQTAAEEAKGESVESQGANQQETESATADTEGLESDTDKDWKKEYLKLEEQMASYHDQALRATAEAQNTRRRAEQDVEKAHKFALEKFSKELLPVIDSLEKALETERAQGNETTPLLEGVEMTLGILISALGKFNLEQVNPEGEPFDPTLHEAISMIDAPDAESNSVITVVQKGYTLNGRLIRPAMVVVSR